MQSLLLLLLVLIQQAPFHVLKIASGPAGKETSGIFAFDEERSVFNRQTDREVIVFFQWDGSPGTHRMAATWRSPDGGTSSTSPFDYKAVDRRFGAIWRLPVSPSMALGNWSIEATVDGQPAGRYTFDMTDVEAPRGAPTRRPLSQAELFERLARGSILIRRSSATGRDLAEAAGVGFSGGRLLTALAALDETDRIRVVAADGSMRDVTGAIAVSRAQDWAIVDGAASEAPELPMADAIKVGDRCYTIEASQTSGKVLVEGQITGESPGGGWLAGFTTGTGTPGAPLVNEYGEAVGILGAVTLQLRSQTKGVPVIPVRQIRPDAATARGTFAELKARGDLLAPVVGDEHVMNAGFAASISKSTGPALPSPVDDRNAFSVAEKGFVVFLAWYARDRLKGTVFLRMFDQNNTKLAESKPGKRDIRKGEYAWVSWDIPMPKTPGLYRAEVIFEGKPMWRGYVRINP